MTEEFDREALFRADDYLYFYGHGVRGMALTDERSDAEADLIWRVLGLQPGERVLDLACGHGRIANRLAARGVQVTGLDESEDFLDLARRDASDRGVDVDYVRGDIRDIRWRAEFDAVLNWFTAFGYFDDEGCRRVLRGARSALRPKGRFLVEMNHRDFILRNFQPASVGRIGDDLMIDVREWVEPLTGRMHTERTFVRDGNVRTSTYFVRMFTFTELRDWLLQADFSTADGLGEDGEPLRSDHRRMLVLATAG